VNWRKVRLIATTTALLVLSGKGAYEIVVPDKPIVQAENSAIKSPLNVEFAKGAENYAVYFANYWFTGDLESAKKYVAVGFEVPKEMPKPQKIETIVPWGARSLGNKEVSVTIRVKPINQSAFFVDVPVAVDGGRYGVIGVPNYIPEPSPAKMPDEKAVQQVQDQKTKKEVERVIESFFRQYTAGTPEDLANLFVDGNPRKVLDIQAQFVDLINLQVSEPQNDKLYAKATARFSVEGQNVPQHFEFWFKKNGNRWLIESTNPAISTP
jgi:Conjugative transposon protein TcpC